MKTSRQNWIIETLKKYKDGLTLKEINDLWTKSFEYDGKDMGRIKFFRDKRVIKDMFGVDIASIFHADKSVYYLPNPESLTENTLPNWLRANITVNNVLSQCASLQDRILLESIPSGGSDLQDIIEAMKGNHKLLIAYHKYKEDEPTYRILSPYALKFWKQRWYLLANSVVTVTDENYEAALKNKEKRFRVFSLDRIESVEMLKSTFKLPEDFVASEYFKDYFGVLSDDSIKTETVILRVYGKLVNYFRDLPIHHSQHEVCQEDNYSDFEFKIAPTEDFCNELLSYGASVKVIVPKSLATHIKERHLKAVQNYDE